MKQRFLETIHLLSLHFIVWCRLIVSVDAGIVELLLQFSLFLSLFGSELFIVHSTGLFSDVVRDDTLVVDDLLELDTQILEDVTLCSSLLEFLLKDITNRDGEST